MRVPDWQAKFWKNLEAARERPFEWGVHDCVMFGTASIDVVLGTDYVAQARARYPYSAEAQALALMQQFGGITGLVASFLGDPTNWGRLGHGDIVLIEPSAFLGTKTEMLCVHDGVNLIAPAARGINRVPFKYAIHGWKIT